MVRVVFLLSLLLVLAASLTSNAKASDGDDDDFMPNVLAHTEVARLEALKKSGKLVDDAKERLGEIYFLTSRCDDVKKLFKQGRLLCACGGKCEKTSEERKIQDFKKLFIEQKKGFRDPRVQALWKPIQSSLEARYWALKGLRLSRDPKIRSIRAELEQSLESLEVKAP